MIPSEPAERRVGLIAGIAAYREGERLRWSLDSLVGQELPEGVAWREFRIAVPADDLGTLSVARRCAAADPRVRLLVEPYRQGKSAALAEILRHDGADYFVLLNGDARARPGAVAELVRRAGTLPGRPLAIMGRPIPLSTDRTTLLAASLGLLWRFHDLYHRELLSSDQMPHLSDELLLIGSERRPTLPPGIVNDGAYLAAELRRLGGTLAYAPSAEVEIVVPERWRDLWIQRRRIHAGHRQIGAMFGRPPGSFGDRAVRHPIDGAARIARELLRTGRGVPAGAALILTEIWANLVARLDGPDPGPKFARWRRIQDPVLEEDTGPIEPIETLARRGGATTSLASGPAHKP
ncbi:MAG: glycosyltransferase family 2 protein [Thermoplasmata archaeon]